MALALLITIALGIGSNVAVNGFVRGLTGFSSPLTNDGRIVSIFGRDLHRQAGPVSYKEYLAVKGKLAGFEWVGAAHVSQGAIAFAGQSAVAPVAAITPELSRLLGLSLREGVVISHTIWLGEFGAKPDVVGDQIRIDGVDTRVSGVAPEWLEGLYRDHAVDVWMPLPEEGLNELDRGSRNFWVLGRLRGDVPAGRTQRLVQPGGSEFLVFPYTGMTPETAAGLSRVGTLLGLAAGAVFFIACANVASFLLGRAFARSHETAIRIALGARRGQLVWELLSDSVVIAVAGGAAGTLLAVWTSSGLPALLYESDAARLVFAPDLLSVVAASAACVGVTIACGLVPVLVMRHDRPVAVLRRESAGPSLPLRRLRMGLVVAQMASCCVLVISTAMLTEGLRTALATNAGHKLGQTFLATLQADSLMGIHYFQHVEEATRSMAGVSRIEWAGRLPGSEPTWKSFRIEPAQLPARDVQLDVAWFTSDSLALFRTPPKQGRLFGFGEQTCRAAIINETAAGELFGANSAGRVLHDSAGVPVEVIGVVAMRNPAGGNRPTIYYNHLNQEGPTPSRIAGMRFRAPIASELPTRELDTYVVSAGYFDALGLPVLAGLSFAGHTFRECRTGMVNREAADLYFGGSAVGSALIDGDGRRTTIVGVTQSAPLGTFQRQVEPALYLPMLQDPLPRMTMIVQARESNGPALADLRRVIESVQGSGPAPMILRTLDTYLTQTSLAPLHIATMILGASGTMALLLSVLGLFGALSDAARQRRRELAMRMALGAQRWRVIGHVMGEGGRLACAGAAAGMLGSLVLSRWLTGITGGSGSPPLWVWLSAPLALLGAVAIASFVPARRAMVVNPIMVLRDEN
jgi:ABC-type lipoprotein release transport system permease subunit